MDKIKEYDVIEKIGQGGMAAVYKARQSSLDRLVAIKVLSTKLTENKEVVERFNLEALIVAKLTHPNIIHIIDRGITEGRHFFVMAFVEGPDFAQVVKAGTYDAKRKIDVIMQVCKGLSYAHKNGVIHRDIKPSNIMIDGEGNALVTDFGIAQFFDRHNKKGGENLTSDGAIMGTLAYMSPEQKVDSGKVTSLTDIFSVGVIMYEMFTGIKPFGRFKLPSDINPKFPKPIEKVMMKCLETDPKDRYQTADELKDVLLGLLKGSHIRKKQKEKVFHGITKIENNFILLDIIREHKYGAVYLFERKDDHQLMVIKKSKGQKIGLKESRLLADLFHSNIVKIHGVSGNDALFITVMEYMDGGSLKDRMIKVFKWPKVLKLAREICNGMSYAHQNRIVHGNLRPTNILLNHKGELKVSDFGLNDHYTNRGLDSNWYHPEGEEKSYAADIYSAGVIFFEMLTGNIPKWKDGELVSNEKFGSLPIRIQRVVLRMISLDIEKRPENFTSVTEEIDRIICSRKKKKPKKVSGTKPLILLLLIAIGLASYFYKSEVFEFINNLF